MSSSRGDWIVEFGENLRRAGPELWAFGVLPGLAGVAALLASPWLWFGFAALAVFFGVTAADEYAFVRARNTPPGQDRGESRGEHVAVGVLVGAIAPLAAAVVASGLLSGAGWIISTGAPAGMSWLAAQPATHLVTDPITGWFSAHAAGLPVSAFTLGLIAATGAALLYVAALGGSLIGRVGFALVGAGAAFMVWTGTVLADNRPVAAGLTVLAWFVLALPVYTRRRRGPTVLVCHHTDTAA